MRPVVIPDEPSGFKYTAKKGREALANHIENMCLYCERNVGKDNIEIEHIIPQNRGHSIYTKKWYNLLLSCGGCNKAKKRPKYKVTRDNFHTFVWPHIDDTFSLIDYHPVTKMPKPKEELSDIDKERVNKTLKMFKFISEKDNKDVDFKDITELDQFAKDRYDAFDTAKRKMEEYIAGKQENDPEKCESVIKDIKYLAKKDNWSAYVYVFNDIKEVRNPLLEGIKGTDITYFEDLSQQAREEYNKYKYYRYYLQITITELETTQLSKADIQRERKEAKTIKAEIKQMSTISKEQKIELLTNIQTILEILK